MQIHAPCPSTTKALKYKQNKEHREVHEQDFTINFILHLHPSEADKEIKVFYLKMAKDTQKKSEQDLQHSRGSQKLKWTPLLAEFMRLSTIFNESGFFISHVHC